MTRQTTKSKKGQLHAMHQRIKAMDPLSGPNVMRYAQQHFKDNGDGTMTLRRSQPYLPESNADKKTT